jgi:DNA polymerase III epsilon subunit-like protein
VIVIDIETSGLDPEINGLLSIGAVDFLNPKAVFYGECRLKPSEIADSTALGINGFSEQQIRSRQAQPTKLLLQSFAEWLSARKVKVLAGLHISAFDVPFLNAKAKQNRVALKLHRRTVDLHTLAYAKMLSLGRLIPMTEGWSVMDTDQIHPFCGLPSEPKPHIAINGAKWEAEAISRLIYGKNLLGEFTQYEIPSYLSTLPFRS